MDGKKGKNSDYIMKLNIFIGICMLVIVSILVLSRTRYTVYGADDFYNAQQFGGKFDSVKIAFKEGVECLKYAYFYWQGTFFSSFFFPVLSPLSGLGAKQLILVMISSNLLFILSIILFIRSLIPETQKRLLMAFSLTGCLLFTLFLSGTYPEVFTWYTGMVVYLLPFYMLLFGLAIIYLDKELNIKATILACIFCICGMGGSLVISGMGCYLILLRIAYRYIQNNKIDKMRFCVFGCTFVFALVNTLAPGNFSRKATIDNQLNSLLDVFVNTIRLGLLEYRNVFSIKGFIGIILIMLFSITICVDNDVKIIRPKISMILGILYLLVPFVVIFPYVLGMSSAEGMADRVRFVFDISIFIGWVCFANILGRMIKKEVISDTYIKISLLVGIIILIGITLKTDNNLTQISEDIRNGTYKVYYNECFKLYDYLENEEGDVIINSEKYPIPVRNMYTFYMPPHEKDHWICIGISNYYELDSVEYIP